MSQTEKTFKIAFSIVMVLFFLFLAVTAIASASCGSGGDIGGF